MQACYAYGARIDSSTPTRLIDQLAQRQAIKDASASAAPHRATKSSTPPKSYDQSFVVIIADKLYANNLRPQCTSNYYLYTNKRLQQPSRRLHPLQIEPSELQSIFIFARFTFCNLFRLLRQQNGRKSALRAADNGDLLCFFIRLWLARFMVVPVFACPVLATPARAFVPDALPSLTSSARRAAYLVCTNSSKSLPLLPQQRHHRPRLQRPHPRLHRHRHQGLSSQLPLSSTSDCAPVRPSATLMLFASLPIRLQGGGVRVYYG